MSGWKVCGTSALIDASRSFADVSVSDVNEEQEHGGGSSKDNSINSEHSLQSHGISHSSQESSTNSLPVSMADPNHAMVAAAMSQAGSSGASMAAVTAQMDQMALGFHRPQQSASAAAAVAQLQPKSKLTQVNPRKMFPGPMDSSSMDDDSGIDPKNFATIRTTSIVQRQQKEHLQEEMHEQMSGYKRMRRDHQAALARLEDNCRQEMEKHKNLLDREYEQLLTQFSKDLERLQVKHQEELAKTVGILFKSKKSAAVLILIFAPLSSSSTLLRRRSS